ncbi:MAG: sigma-54 interaction domain-containing protein, partial [Sedimentibacter sp.]
MEGSNMGQGIKYYNEQFQKYSDKNLWLVELVRRHIDGLCSQYCHMNFVVSLMDRYSEIIIMERSNDSDKVDLLKSNIKNQIRLNKKNTDLSTIPLHLVNGKGDDKSCIELISEGNGACYRHSEPIYDNSEITFYLTLTGFKDEVDKHLNSALSLVSQSICSLVEMYKVIKKLEIQNDFRGLLIDASSDGMLSVDMDGIITFINPAGMRILNIDNNIIGKHISDGVDFEPTILHVLKNKKGYVDKEFRIESKCGAIHFVKTAIPLKDENGKMVGVLDIFRNIVEVKSMVNRMTGAQAKYSIFNIIGESPEIQEVKKIIKVAGLNDIPVLIHGESGTGKDIIAQAIHNYSSRSNGPFVTVDCESLPRNLLESELFGYEEGSFTSQNTGGRPGKIELAYGGTLFLNNVGYIPLDVQTKLSNVFQQNSVVRIGGFNEIPIDVRVICTSNINLKDMITDNNFREDLFNIISLINLKTPPLRERDEDIDLITNQTLNQYNLINGTNKELSAEARLLLHNWFWPGNVRELENAIEYAYCLAKDNIILP